MGFFSRIGSFSGLSDFATDSEQETPEELRKKNGFSNFSSDMERLRNYDPQAELEKATATDAATPPPSRLAKSPRK